MGLFLRYARRSYGVHDAAVVMAAAFAVSALLGMLRQLLLSATFGDSAAAAAYYAAARLPETLVTLVAGGALTAALVPVLVREADADQRRVVDALAAVVAVAVTCASLIGVAAAPWLVRALLLPGSDADTQALTIGLTRVLFAQPLLLALASLCTATLTVHTRFTLVAVAYVSHNLTIILGILAARTWPAISVYGPAVGLVGAAAVKLALVWWGTRLNESPLWFRWEPRLPQLRSILLLALPTAASVTVNYSGTLVDTAYASQIGVTAVAALYSAWLLADMPTRLVGSAIGQALFPHLAKAAAAGDYAGLTRQFLRTSLVGLALTIPIVAALWYAGRWGIAVVLERGVFDAAAGDRTYAALRWYALGIPAFVLTELLSRLLNALHDTRTPLYTNIGQFTTKAVALWLIGSTAGFELVPVLHSLTCATETLVLVVVVWVKIRRLQRLSPNAAGTVHTCALSVPDDSRDD
jgi:putative peptidoglycan lipid II flippase